MIYYQSFVYLDVQKTGSTYIVHFCNLFCKEDLVFKKKHERLSATCDPDKFYFISTRDPVSSYRSLYSFGCGGEGGLHQRLTQAGKGHLYSGPEGFETWLDFMLDPANSRFVRESYGSREAEKLRELVGFMSFRHLMLSVPAPLDVFKNCQTREDLQKTFEEHRIYSRIIRQEHMSQDMKELVVGPLAHAFPDQDAALAYLDGGETVNSSQPSKRVSSVAQELVDRITEREWFLSAAVHNGAT